MKKEIKAQKNLTILLLLMAGLVALIISYFAGMPIRMDLFNSDELYLPILFADLMSQKGHLSDWFLTPAPYFFPDYGFFFFAYLLGSNVYIQIPIFFTIQALSTFFSIWFLFNTMKGEQPFLLAGTTSIVLFWLALNGSFSFRFLLESAIHYGTFLNSLIFLGLWFQLENRSVPIDSTRFWFLSILAFLATLSDALFIPQTIVPFVVTATTMAVFDKKFTIKKIIYILIPAFFSLLGALGYSYLVVNHTRSAIGVTLSFKSLWVTMNHFFAIFYSTCIKVPIYGFIFITYSSLGIFSIRQFLKLIHRRHDVEALYRLVWLVVFSSMCIFATSMIMILTGLPKDRYLIPIFYWPVIMSILLLCHYLGRSRVFFCIAIAFLITGSLIFSTYRLLRANGLMSYYYPSEIACIDEVLNNAGLSNGISEYWDAKYFKAFSKLDLNIAQYDMNLKMYPWITSKKYFREKYDFAIISEKRMPAQKIPLEIIRRINGQPEQIVYCGNKTLYIYGKNKLRIRKLSEVGDSYIWKGCELPTKIGEKTSKCGMKKKNISESGHVTFGPYEPLPFGTYTFEMGYSSCADITQSAGIWDVVLTLPNEAKVLAKGQTGGTNGRAGTINGTFTLDAKHNMGRIEVRNWAYQNMGLNIKYLQLTKVS